MKSTKKTLIYDPYYTGHHSEYINNLWVSFKQNPPVNKIYLAIHPKVVDILKYDIDVTILNVELIILHVSKKHSLFSKYFSQLFEINKIVKENNIENVILLILNPLFVYLAFGHYQFNISGIVFNPFTPHYESYSVFQRLYKQILYFVASKREKIQSLFILNDKKTCEYLNKHFHTDKFRYLPDPIPFYVIEDLPKEIAEIKKHRKIALHFGAMSNRKGTLLILDVIKLLPQEILSQISFFFVGKPCSIIFDEILKEKIRKLQNRFPELNIYYHPFFVSNGQMEAYYEFSDFVLMPYLSNNMSSGVMGHAAKYNKPVIVGRGLLGNLVDEYHLGESIDLSEENLANSLLQMIINNKLIDGNVFIEKHSVLSFVTKLIYE
jgi:hypothetical protein